MNPAKRREIIKAIHEMNARIDRYEKALHRIVKSTKAYELPNEIARDALNKGVK